MNLEFIRLSHPDQFKLIPRELFEQVRDNDPDVILENIYKHGPEQLSNADNFIYVMVDDKPSVKGVLWAGINAFSEILEVSILSVDKEHQNNGACKQSLEFLQEIQKEHNLRKVRWMTTRGKNYKDK